MGLVSSQNYMFKVRAQNVYGYVDFSYTVIIRTSYMPDEMTPVTTTTILQSIVVSWTPASDSGEPID